MQRTQMRPACGNGAGLMHGKFDPSGGAKYALYGRSHVAKEFGYGKAGLKNVSKKADEIRLCGSELHADDLHGRM